MVETERSVGKRALAGRALAPAQLEKAFLGFAKARGVNVDALTPRTALDLVCAFYDAVRFQGRAHGNGDMLLYQHGTRGAETTVGFVRQLYHRGLGQQLCVDLVYPAEKLRFAEAVSLWSQKSPTLQEWATTAKKLLGAAEQSAASPRVKVSLERF